MSGGTTRVRYVPLERRRQGQGGEYAARRALFLQSYRFSVDAQRRREGDDEEEGLRGRLARRLRSAVARARGWCVGAGTVTRAWRPRADHPLLGCFGPGYRHKYYLHDYA